MRKVLIIVLAIMLSDMASLTVLADRYIDDQSVKVNNEQVVNVGGDSSGDSSPTNNTSIGGLDSGGSGGGATGEGNNSTTNVTVEVMQNVDVHIGSHLELSAHLIESVQGLNRGTYIPQYDEAKGLETLETKYSSFMEYRNFDADSKRKSIFTQTEDNAFSLDYVEALNWLYKNNYIHRFEDLKFEFTEKETDDAEGELVASNSASGGEEEHTLDIDLPEGDFVIKYDMYTVPDALAVFSKSGEELASTGGQVSGEGQLKFSTTGERIKIITNDGDGLAGTAWYYDVMSSESTSHIPKNVTDVAITERPQKDEFFFPKNKELHNTITKKDFIMQLMKVIDGVEESRPLMFESRYELTDFKTGGRAEVIGYLPVLETPFVDQIGETGIEIGVNKLDVDFNKYGMAKYYANPNVYELYLSKAFNSGIISYNELEETPLRKSLLSEFTFSNKACIKDDKDEGPHKITDPLKYLTQEELEEVYLKFETDYNIDLNEYKLEFELNKDGSMNINSVPIANKDNNGSNDGTGTTLNPCDTAMYSTEETNSANSRDFTNVVASADNSFLRSLFGNVANQPNSNGATANTGNNNASTGTQNNNVRRSTVEYDLTKQVKYGTPLPSWENALEPVRINYLRTINNDGEFNVKHDTGAFGSSWSNPLEGTESDTKISGEYKYDPDFEYFTNESLSYVEAVMYAYKAINAYADEKLPQREVDTIMSMFSVNYGSLNENEINALNYLIAKGLIDGDNSAKYTSTQPITVEDAIILTYRIANPSARLTFKTTFGDIDALMLSNGYAQSKTTMSSFEGVLPDLEVESPEPTEYFIIMNKPLTENNYVLSTAKNVVELDSSIKETVDTYSSRRLSQLGLKVNKGTYTVKKYEVPWDLDVQQLGFMHTSSKSNIPSWINIPLGGGFYLINEDSFNSGIGELSFTKVNPDYTGINNSDTPAVAKESEGVKPSGEEEEGFFQGVYDKVASFLGLDDNEEKQEKQVNDTEYAPTVDLNGNLNIRHNQDISDDNDPLGILDFANPLLKTLYMDTYEADDDKDKPKKVYIGVNSSAKANLLFDGHALFKGGEINNEIVSATKDLESIKILDNMPKDQNGKDIFSDTSKTFVEFVFPSTNRRSITELKSLVQRRLTLTGESEIKDEDISSYTGSANGQTLISRKELSMFGVTATKDNPDILYHAGTATYAYLNTEDNYALISNTVVKFPENSVMIEINADEIYYNVNVVMSMMNSKAYYLFNDEGKYQIVSTLSSIEQEPILNPTTGAYVDNSYIANIESYKSEKDKSLTEKGKYLNISSISKTPATFFMTMNELNKRKRIYGFEPYYVKSTPTNPDSTVNINQVTDELSKRNVDILFIENVLINNALVRQEFFVPKSETFLYVDNAIKVTELTEEKSYSVYAEKYLEFIESIYENISVEDIRSEALIFKDANSYYSNKKFELTDLLNRSNFHKGETQAVTKLIKAVKEGNKPSDVKAFWVLYFLGKFNLELPQEADGGDGITKFKTELVKQFNKKYKFSTGFALGKNEHINLLDMNYVTETDIQEKRRYEVKRLYPVNMGSFMTTDEEIFINTNRAVYMKLSNKKGEAVSYQSTEPKTAIGKELKTFELPTYANGGSTDTLTVEELKSLQYQRDILGNSFYVENGKLYNPQTTYYTSLPQGRVPLRNLHNGATFTVNTTSGAQKMVVLNNTYLDTNNDLMVKVAKINLTKADFSFDATSEEKLTTHYKDIEIYKKSLNSIGEFIRAVNRNAKPIDRVVTPRDLPTGSSRIYFNYSNKKIDTSYKILTSNSSSAIKSNLRDLIVMDKNTNATKIDATNKNARLSYYDSSTADIKHLESESGTPQGVAPVTTKNEVLLYDTYLFNYGTVSVDADGFAHLDIRSDYVLNTSPVVTDLVNQLVKQVNRDSVKTESKKVGDLVSGEKLMVSDGSQTSESLMLIKTDTKEHKGHSHFISSHTMNNTVTPSFISHSSSLLIANAELFDSVKVWAGGQRLPLYNFIGNRELNLAKPNDIEKYKNSISLVNVSGNSKILVETKNGNSTEAKKYTFSGSANTTSFTTGEVKSLTDSETDEAFNYLLSLYLNSNLLVKLHSSGYYVIDEYGTDGLVNTTAFTSRASRFEGVKNSLLTVLPTYSAVDGKFLGFDLTALELESLKDLFNSEWWSNLFSNIIMNAEIILSALGFYYIYILMVLVILARSLTGFMQTFVNKLLRLITFGRLDIDQLQLRKFIPRCMLVLVLLTFTYSGAVRDVIITVEEIRIGILETFVYPFKK